MAKEGRKEGRAFIYMVAKLLKTGNPFRVYLFSKV
jgi:hypothetical protein